MEDQEALQALQKEESVFEMKFLKADVILKRLEELEERIKVLEQDPKIQTKKKKYFFC
jgi:NH3-dependent NAD+ synthetase